PVLECVTVGINLTLWMCVIPSKFAIDVAFFCFVNEIIGVVFLLVDSFLSLFGINVVIIN
ncbi:1550_t:CDS:1, partial [Gigaspora margarita]